MVERFSAYNIMWSIDGVPLEPTADGQFVRYSDYAALEAKLAERVKVKPLEWSWHPAGGEQALAAGLGIYRVHENRDDWYLVPGHMGTGGKAAAQADYERRILSALED